MGIRKYSALLADRSTSHISALKSRVLDIKYRLKGEGCARVLDILPASLSRSSKRGHKEHRVGVTSLLYGSINSVLPRFPFFASGLEFR